jgi:spore photoproduct lyase
MKFDLDAVVFEESCRTGALAARITGALPPGFEVTYVDDGREAARPAANAKDPFAAGKRRMVVMPRRAPFLMGCPAGSADFACCGLLVMVLASNCPMDCSYCFLQEYVADNPGFQVYANYTEAFDELDRLGRGAPGRTFRVGTGELADSLAFDTLTGVSRDLVEYFAGRGNLLLELKTKTAEIDNLLRVDPKGRTLVSWSLSPAAVYQSCEHRTAAPAIRLDAARRVAGAGYKVGFHLDPMFAYPGADRDYGQLIDDLFDTIAPDRVAYISMGGLRMTPGLRAAARRRFPDDPMLLGEEVIAPDGRWRTFTPLRLRLFTSVREHIMRAAPGLKLYLCMETASVHERVFGRQPPPPAALGARLAEG